jgi:hypothetical protein
MKLVCHSTTGLHGFVPMRRFVRRGPRNVSMMRTTDRDLLTAAISFTVAVFVVFSRWNPLWALGTGTCVSVRALHLSRFH